MELLTVSSSCEPLTKHRHVPQNTVQVFMLLCNHGSVLILDKHDCWLFFKPLCQPIQHFLPLSLTPPIFPAVTKFFRISHYQTWPEMINILSCLLQHLNISLLSGWIVSTHFFFPSSTSFFFFCTPPYSSSSSCDSSAFICNWIKALNKLLSHCCCLHI